MALSTGLDSTVLLDLLATLAPELEIDLSVLHVDHGLRPEHVVEATSARRAAESYGLPLWIVPVSVPRSADGRASEESCRRLRLEAYRRVQAASGATCVATGHTLDDQAETVLLRLGRGAGLVGLGGMAFERRFQDGLRIVRPLLGESRGVLADHAAAGGLFWHEDSSNRSARYLRNRVRHELLPLLADLFGPAVAERIGGIARRMSGEHEALTALLEAEEGRLYRVRESRETAGGALAFIGPVVTVELVEARALPEAALATLLRFLLHRQGVREGLYSVHLANLVRFAAGSEGSAVLHLPAGLSALRVYDELHLGRLASPGVSGAEVETPPLVLPGPGRFERGGLAFTLSLGEAEDGVERGPATLIAASPSPLPLTLRPPHPGERLPLTSGGRRSVRRMLIDRKIPRLLRSQALVLADCRDHPLWLIAPSGILAPSGRLGGETSCAWREVYRTAHRRPGCDDAVQYVCVVEWAGNDYAV